MKAKTSMRLLWVTGRYPPQKGGMAVSCDRLVAGLRRRGRGVDVVAFTASPEIKKARIEDRDHGADLFIGVDPSPGAAAQMAFALAQRRAELGPYDLVVGFGANFPGQVATTFAAWLGLPSLVLVRGNDFDRDWFEPRPGGYVREALARATAIGATSPVAAARIQALFPSARIIWTPNGIDARLWELLPADREVRDRTREELGGDGRRIIGVFGEIKFKKRLPLFLGALRDAGLKDRVSLLVVGALDVESEQILDDPALSPRQKRLPFLRRDELPGLYSACDFVALPSLFEGMPNVLIEAMARGVVPIASDAGAMAMVIEDGSSGFVFPAEDRGAASQAVAKALALTDSELAAMSEKARERVAREFTLERELETILELLSSMVRGK